ncbi:MAG: 50S ribosomal protein L4 [Candidatus Aenigmarchaeota archaeon]|nr:50S ribosomal protein L4 [Candidatus Aenigmarchaeota archaeon]
MQVSVYDLNGKERGKVSLPKAFGEKVRADLIKRAVLAEQSWNRQSYGSDPLAGQRSSAHYHGRRQTRYSMMNREMSRMRRIHNSGFLNLTARIEPYATKGRRAHPPKAEKVWDLKINRKEWKKALNSAVAASADKDLVSKRHRSRDIAVPIVFEDAFQDIKKTKEVVSLLLSIGLKDELDRCSEKKIRSGRGKTRGRKYKKRKGPLIIINDDKGIEKAAKGIPGIDVTKASELTTELLAPGTQPGRMTIWSKTAIAEFGKKREDNAGKEKK